MNDGWVRLHRKSLDSTVWKDEVIWKVWCWCLFKASHNGNYFPFNGKTIDLKPGQFITGRHVATQELGLTERRYRRALDYLKTSNRVSIKTTNKYSIITVINWKLYQPNVQQPVVQNVQQTIQQTSTIKNANNTKKKINKKESEVLPFGAKYITPEDYF